VATDAFQFDGPKRLGFDALVEFPPHGLVPPRIEAKLAWLNAGHRGAVFDYQIAAEEAATGLRRRHRAAHDVLPGVMPGWDNEARRPGAGNIFHNASPEAYAGWLKAACECAARTLPANRRFVFVNAWNEWAEGAYLEPDRKWGRAFLEATALVMGASGATALEDGHAESVASSD
jgi:lipopolysaccharide biosynthesis protein